MQEDRRFIRMGPVIPNLHARKLLRLVQRLVVALPSPTSAELIELKRDAVDEINRLLVLNKGDLS